MDNAFTGDKKITTEYEAIKLAIPHHDEFQDQVGLHLKRSFPRRSALKVLEIGVGTGLTTEVLVRDLEQPDIVGVDISEAMLEGAREKETLTDVQFVCADVLEFLRTQPSDSFDAVVSAYCLHNLTDAERMAICFDVHRVLKLNGIFINADKYAHEDEGVYRVVYDQQIERLANMPAELEAEWAEHYEFDDQPGIRLIDGEFAKQLAFAKFTSVTMTYRHMLEGVIIATKVAL